MKWIIEQRLLVWNNRLSLSRIERSIIKCILQLVNCLLTFWINDLKARYIKAHILWRIAYYYYKTPTFMFLFLIKIVLLIKLKTRRCFCCSRVIEEVSSIFRLAFFLSSYLVFRFEISFSLFVLALYCVSSRNLVFQSVNDSEFCSFVIESVILNAAAWELPSSMINLCL